MPIHSCEHFDWLINCDNATVTDVLDRLDEDFSAMRTPVTRDELAPLAAPDTQPPLLPQSPNQLHVPGPNVRDWARQDRHERLDTTATDTAVAQFAPLGISSYPVFDPTLVLLAAQILMQQQQHQQILFSMPSVPPATAVTAATTVAVGCGGSMGGSMVMVPMMLGDREVHIPRERVLYTQGSHAYFQAASSNNGKGIGRSVCRHWLQKRCTYGEKCSFIHVTHLEPAQQHIFDDWVHKARSPKK